MRIKSGAAVLPESQTAATTPTNTTGKDTTPTNAEGCSEHNASFCQLCGTPLTVSAGWGICLGCEIRAAA